MVSDKPTAGGDGEELHARLRALGSLDQVRELAAWLGFDWRDDSLPAGNLSAEVRRGVDTESLRVIGEVAGIPVLFARFTGRSQCESDCRLSMLTRRLPAQLPVHCRNDSLMIVASAGFEQVHIVNAGPAGGHPVLRRHIIGRGKNLRCAVKWLGKLQVCAGTSREAAVAGIDAAFDCDALGAEFLSSFAGLFSRVRQEFAAQGVDAGRAHDSAHTLLGRLMVVRLIQSCSLPVAPDDGRGPLKILWRACCTGDCPADTYLSQCVSSLLFSGTGHRDSGELNIKVSDAMFEDIFESILDSYSYTVAEDTPYDQTIAVNPEMLGRVYESLAGAGEDGGECSEAGIFYTPRIEVDFMCRRALVEYLDTHVGMSREDIYRFVFGDKGGQARTQSGHGQLTQLSDALQDIKVVDPACGSGAFLVGMLQVLLELRREVRQWQGGAQESFDEYSECRQIVEHVLHGVDVKSHAVGIARVRLRLAMLDAAARCGHCPDAVGDTVLSGLSHTLRVGDSLASQRSGDDAGGGFCWAEAYAGVFRERGGFDVVIGNPPYVRQEKIADPLAADDVIAPDAEQKRRYKDRLRQTLEEDWGRDARLISRRADLYVYFYLRGLALVNGRGTCMFITGNAWLDVGYGAGLQEFLLKHSRLLALYDNEARRSFKRAGVNTVMAVFQPLPAGSGIVNDHLTRFVLLKRPLAEIVYSRVLLKIEEATGRSIINAAGRPKQALAQVVSVRRDELTLAGCEAGTGRNTRGGWGGRYLRAPEIYWTLLEKGRGKFIHLGDIATVRFGIKTGANGFFYLPNRSFDVAGQAGGGVVLIPKAGKETRPVDIGTHAKRVVFSLRDIDGLSLPSARAGRWLFQVPAVDRGELPPGVQEYIRWGECQGFDQSASCLARKYWYSLAGNWAPASFVFPSKIGARFVVCRNDAGWLEDKKLYGITPGCLSATPAQWTVALNSVVFWLLIELAARQLTGSQAIADVDVRVVAGTPVLDPARLPQHACEAACSRLSRRIESCFMEFGYDRQAPAPVKLSRIKPDRLALDKLVFDALELSRDERVQVYDAIIGIVGNRLAKADSV